MQQKRTLLALHYWPGRLLLFRQLFGYVLGILLYILVVFSILVVDKSYKYW